jgi:hypothetical protein
MVQRPRRSSQKGSSAPPAEEEALLQRLKEALSDAEIRRVVASAVLVLDGPSQKRLLARLAPETAAALVPALAPPRKDARSPKPAPVAAGKGKVRQEWDRLWQDWAHVVDESGAEHGDYVHQDADWEAPYLDPYSIANDLDAIASRIRGLMPRVIAEGIASDFSFAQAIREMDDALYAGLPDWIADGSGEPCCLGREATACLLEWEWTVAQREGRDAAAFLDDIRDLETSLKKVDLDDQAMTTFVSGLSDEQLRALLASMERQRSSPRWADAFTHAHGCWPGILRHLFKRWNPTRFAEISRANIAQDWTLALPLVASAVKRKAFAEAATIIDEALRARLRLDETKRWNPCEELLVQQLSRYGEDEGTKLATLLRRWWETAQGQGQQDLAAALALQITALDSAEDGERMLDAFRAFPPQFHPIREALFANWRALIVGRTLDIWRDGDRVACGDWVSALVDAARAGPGGAALFHDAVRAALEEARAVRVATPQPMWSQRWNPHQGATESLFALAILTRDLDATVPTLKGLAPKLWKLFAAENHDVRKRLAATRRRWCKFLGGESLVPEIVTFWRENAVRFVPDPGSITGDYSHSTDWLAAVREINPKAASEVCARWAAAYHRKRNLWRDLAQRNFPIPPGVRGSRELEG